MAEVLLSGTPAQSKRALLFLILNAARSGAVRNLTFEEIDFEQAVWTMQAHALERKTNVTRYYPLSRQSLKLLYFQQQHRDAQHMSCPLVFPTKKANKKDSWALSDMTLTALLRDHTADFTADISARTPTAHGFRTAFKSWATVGGYNDKWSELQLAHEIGNAVQQAYDREQLLEQRRQMIQAWADFVWPLRNEADMR